jgi:hypothetical protein
MCRVRENAEKLGSTRRANAPRAIHSVARRRVVNRLGDRHEFRWSVIRRAYAPAALELAG